MKGLSSDHLAFWWFYKFVYEVLNKLTINEINYFIQLVKFYTILFIKKNGSGYSNVIH